VHAFEFFGGVTASIVPDNRILTVNSVFVSAEGIAIL